MNRERVFALHPMAMQDLVDVWLLVRRNDGEERADRLVARIEAFVRSLEEFPQVGTRHDERRIGLRSCGVPGLKTVTVVFRVAVDCVTVLRVGYLGRDVMSQLPNIV